MSCSIVFTRNCSLLAIPFLWFFIRTLAERKCNRHSQCCCVRFTRWEWQGTHKCSINEPLFVLPYCKKSYMWLITYPGYPPHLLAKFFHGFTAGAIQVRRGIIGPLLVSATRTLGSMEFLSWRRLALVSGGRALIRTGDCSWSWLHLYLPWVSSNARQASLTQSHLKTIPN